MDDYPPHSLDHNVPLLVAFGLPQGSGEHSSIDQELKEQGILIRSELPTLEGPQAAALLKCFESKDASGLAWNGNDITRRYRFRIRACGSTYLLPPRRASLPENFEVPKSPAALHSPFSPLSPSCHLYPDGIIDPLWLRKHQELVPSVFLCFYSLTSDPTLATLHDNKIKSDINAVKNAVLQSGYKSRISVVILSDQSTPSVDGVQERLDNIRKGCALDPKTFFFAPSQGAQEELERITDNTLAIVWTQAIEYYRDLGRHSRKKRGRGFAPQPAIPPTSGTSQTLSLPGWNVRYDFKSAVFAEFRQEMDGALKSYEQAYETLLGPDVVEAIPSWSPRWNEGRLLADMIAIRIMRCLLWNGQTSTAVKRWQAHQDRISDLVERIGRGTNNYGWAAWEARWAIVMANLIEKVELPDLGPETSTLFLQPEKRVAGERLPPWELLHHAGYWYRSAARHVKARKALAYTIPEDDRRPPDFSPASKVAGRAFTYDTYMCPPPHEEYPVQGRVGVDHTKMIVECLASARASFLGRRQFRLGAEVSLECAKEYAAVQDWQNVFDLLSPIWKEGLYRLDGWIHITEDLGWTLRAAASELGHDDVVIGVDWELLDRRYTRQRNWHYDITKSVAAKPAGEKVLVRFDEDLVPSFLKVSFIFKTEEGKAGQTCQAQLSISSTAVPGSAPLVFESLRVEFEGSIKPLILHHDPSQAGDDHQQNNVALTNVSLQEESGGDEVTPSLRGNANLLVRPGCTTVMEMAIHLREQGTAKASLMEFSLASDAFILQQSIRLPLTKGGDVWFLSPSSRKRVVRTQPHAVHIQPRPPKLEIKFLDPLDQYYINEHITLSFSLLNAEEADANVKLDVVMFGEEPPGFKLLVSGDEVDTASGHAEETALSSVPLGIIGTSQSLTGTILIDAISLSMDYEFTLRAAYNLVTDPGTSIGQLTRFKLNLVNPFEANYDLLPRLHPDPWPSLFDYEAVVDYTRTDGAARGAHGLAQAWSLVTRYASFASEDLKVTDLRLVIQPTHGVNHRISRRSELPVDGIEIKPKTIEEVHFDLDAQKTSLEDRGPMNLDVSFAIQWQRLNIASPATNTTLLPVPKLSIFGSEPRVLACVSYAQSPHALIFLDITIENVSNHFLTFGLTMEPSDDFAFSGAKQTTMHLLPVSRRSVSYRLLPLVRGAWVKPGLVVRDKYFQKVLRVIPTEGLKLDKDGFLVWVPPEDEEAASDE